MSKTLIIAEKPDMGRTIAAVIEPKAVNKRTYLEGERYVITWAIGHLVGLAEPERYDEKYKRWNDRDLPIIPERFKLWPNARTKEQLKTIGELAKRCDRLINACDAGREGQLIFHLIRQYLKLKQPVDRLWISDLTPETIRRGFETLRSDAEYDALTRAARARSEADWLIGMNASRAFTIRHKALLSVGRVQTPVLALLYDRHREIEAFRPETYYVVAASFLQEKTSYAGVWQGERLTDRMKAEAIAGKVRGKPAAIAKYESAESSEYPFKLYDLTLLQREANGKYGFSAKKTLDIAQSLYEKHKVITYPRTNSNYVTEENIAAMSKALAMLGGTEYAKLAAGADRGRVHKGNRAVCNPAKVEDHHAILPTPKKPSTLNADEQKIYDMIVRRFLAQYYPPARYRNHTVWTICESETFRTKVKELLEPGWKVVQQDADASAARKRKKDGQDEAGPEDETVTDRPFLIDKAKEVRCTEAEAKEKTTQPPEPYTEGTLLKAMESAGKSIEDDELREAMKETGLGTPATRAATIERLKQVGYIAASGKRLDITAKGLTAIELIRGAGVELLASPEMTGQWERRLHQISRGEASDERFMEQVKRFAVQIVEKVRQQQPAAPGTLEDGGRTGSGSRGRKSGRTAGRRSGARVSKPAASAERKEPAAYGSCPKPGCRGTIIEGKRGFGCSAYREGCTFVMWKDQSGKKLTPAMVRDLLQKGETRKLSLRRPDGSEGKGRLVLHDAASGAIRAVFDD